MLHVLQINLLIYLLLAINQTVFAETSLIQNWPHTDFSNKTISMDEILPGGSLKDGIPAFDNPHFITVEQVGGLVMGAVRQDLSYISPAVVVLKIGG